MGQADVLPAARTSFMRFLVRRRLRKRAVNHTMPIKAIANPQPINWDWVKSSLDAVTMK